MKLANHFFTIALLSATVVAIPADVPAATKAAVADSPTTAAGNATSEATPIALGNFSHSCWDIELVGSGNDMTLEAVCANEGGGNNGVVGVYIDNCLSNKNGGLQCKSGGNALHSCSGCYLADGYQFVCTCVRYNGGTDTTSIYLDSCVTNNDGYLRC